MNELQIQHRILTVGDFSLDQMLPENVANIAPLIQNCHSVHSIQLTCIGEYWILYLLPRIPILLQFYLHPTVTYLLFFSKSEGARYDLNFTVSITHTNLTIIITMVLLSVSLK